MCLLEVLIPHDPGKVGGPSSKAVVNLSLQKLHFLNLKARIWLLGFFFTCKGFLLQLDHGWTAAFFDCPRNLLDTHGLQNLGLLNGDLR